jgi:hypothetical protein
MNKILTILLSFTISFSFAQDASYNNLTTNTFTKSGGANAYYGWGVASDNIIDPRPNWRPDFPPYMINNHTGLTLSAHSYYGGIRFYNQGYPNPYDPANGSTLVMSIVNGSVGIGTTNPDTKLAVNGTIHSREVRVDLNVPGPDYVFDPEYQLMELSKLKAYLDKNHHLPEVPSADQMAKDGLNLGEMNTTLLKKVEELTLYVIEKDKQLTEQNEKIIGQQKVNYEQARTNQSQQEQLNELKAKFEILLNSAGKK